MHAESSTLKETVIEVKGLTKKFGDFTAVDHLNFTILRNEIFGLLGPNGAGKTTTINMMCGLIPSTAGEVQYIGKRDHKSIIGYCPQENIYYPKLTCLEQLIFIGQMYGLSAPVIKRNADKLLQLLGLQDKINVRAINLSGGMKRRLNICLALVHDPDILILDEPEAGLDPQSRILVRDFIRKFSKEKTVVLTTHNMDEADRLSDRVAIIDYGRLLLLDTPRNLKKKVGEGDILEIIPEQGNEDKVNDFIRNTTGIADLLSCDSNRILFKQKSILDHVPALKKAAEKSGMPIAEMKFRENTLEDVFIFLTGRKLRQ